MTLTRAHIFSEAINVKIPFLQDLKLNDFLLLHEYVQTIITRHLDIWYIWNFFQVPIK